MESAKAHDEARQAKREAERRGYKWQMSLYGVLTERDTAHSEYRRIEVLSNRPWRSSDVALVYRWLQTVKPIKTYVIYLYDYTGQQLLEWGAWN